MPARPRHVLMSSVACVLLASVAPTLAAPGAGEPWRPRADALASPAPAVTTAPAAPTDTRDGGWQRALTAASKSWTRHLPVPAAKLRLQGEHAVLKVPLWFSTAEAARASEVRVGATTSIAALADTSSLEVYVNGRHLGNVPPRYDMASEMGFPLRAGDLVEGYNEVMFVARNQHRVDCSIGGTYELWTAIDPRLTGIVVNSTSDVAPSLADLPSLLGRNPNPNLLRVHAPNDMTEAGANRIASFVDALILGASMTAPRVVLAEPGAAEREGIAVRLADPVTGTRGLTAFSDAPSLFLETGVNDETLAIVLAGTAESLASDLSRLEAMAAQRAGVGSARGLAALTAARGAEFAETTATTFAEIGVDDREFRGRHLRVDIPTRLPGDFYQADYGNLLVYLDGSYSGGLQRDSVLKVKVNDVETITLPLNDRGPTDFNGRELRIPIGMFHAGLNVLTIEADLVTPSDLLCVPESAPVRTPRFTLLSSSRIVAPRIARVGVVPNLPATLSHGYPYTLDDAPTPVFVVGERRTAFATTLALIAQITSNTQRRETFDIAFRAPNGSEAGILVGSQDALPAFALEMVGTSLARPHEPDTLDGTVPGGSAANGLVRVSSLTDVINDAADTPAHLAAAADGAAQAGGGGLLAGLADRLGAIGEGLREGPRLQLATLGDHLRSIEATVFGDGDPRLMRRVYQSGDIVLAQAAIADRTGFEAFKAAVLPHAAPATWTVAMVPDASALSDAFDGTFVDGVAFNPIGQHYVYGTGGDASIPSGRDGQLYATHAPGPRNLRLVSAGWLSQNVRAYVLLTIPILSLVGLVTFVAARRNRASRAA